MFKRITLLLTVSQGTFSKTRSFNSEHLYTTPHINFSGFDEVIIVCTDNEPNSDFFKFINSMIERLSIPLVISGNILSAEDAKLFFECGADRIILNRCLWYAPEEVIKISNIYGKQAVIASIDFIRNKSNDLVSFDWVKKSNRASLLPSNFSKIIPYIGEILIQDVEQDGRVLGANLESIKEVCNLLPLSLPIHVGSCGLVSWSQYSQILDLSSVDAVSVCNVHHMSIKAVKALRKNCFAKKINIRDIENINI